MQRDPCYHVLLARDRIHCNQICLLKYRLQLIHDCASLPAPTKPKVSSKQGDIFASFRVEEFSSSLYTHITKTYCLGHITS